VKTEKIQQDGTTIAIILRGADWESGLHFASSDGDYLQVGVWGYEKGRKLPAHRHLLVPRQIDRTQELLFVREGRVKADIYGEKDEYLESVELVAGDAIILLGGGHGYETLADNTRVLEVKSGPYVGPEKDRKRL
jgi:quercetin dioxygenase-like cupin family protein